jgi:hypothetical protein
VAEIGGSALLAAGAAGSALVDRRRVPLDAGASADVTTSSTETGDLGLERFDGALETNFSATAFTDALAGDLAVAADLAAAGALVAGFLAGATLAGSALAFGAAARLTGFFESVTGAFVSFLFTISGALQAACVWATLTSC